MKKTNFFVKVAVLASALLLVGGLVSYRAGAFDWLMPSDAPPKGPPIIGGTKSKGVFDPSTVGTEGVQPPADTQPMPAFMGGSKSLSIGPVVTPPVANSPPNSEPPKAPPVFLPGSKSDIGIIPFPPKTQATQPPANPPSQQQPPTVFLPGSKSGTALPPP